MTVATTFSASQSATVRSPGLPATASRLAVRDAKDAVVSRDAEPESRRTSGRRLRSMKGCLSSNSSSVWI